MSRQAPKDRKHIAFVIIDLIMVMLLLCNLLLISFDWIYTNTCLDQWLSAHVHSFFAFYDTHVHAHFLAIDMVFVGIFLTEFVISWIVAAARRQYHRWFFYPLIHWYDLLGCIPLDAFRVVRLLRIFTIVYRLHRLGIVRLDETYLYKTSRRYYDILLEMLTDRVAVNILTEIQEEVRQAGPTLESIVREVLRPKQEPLVDWISQQLTIGVKENFERNRRDIRKYVEEAIAKGFRTNDEIRTIEQIPIAGKVISTTLERSIGNIVYHIVENVARDLASTKNRMLVAEIAEMAFQAIEKKDEDDPLHRLVLETVEQVLESIKKQVSTHRWKLKELATTG